MTARCLTGQPVFGFRETVTCQGRRFPFFQFNDVFKTSSRFRVPMAHWSVNGRRTFSETDGTPAQKYTEYKSNEQSTHTASKQPMMAIEQKRRTVPDSLTRLPKSNVKNQGLILCPCQRQCGAGTNLTEMGTRSNNRCSSNPRTTRSF